MYIKCLLLKYGRRSTIITFPSFIQPKLHNFLYKKTCKTINDIRQL